MATTNAREFLDEVAEMLRAKGRRVEITETQESFGTYVFMAVPADHWYESTMYVNAALSSRTGRWSLSPMTVRTSMGKTFKRDTRSAIRIAADVWA
jgi:hypothetical protein